MTTSNRTLPFHLSEADGRITLCFQRFTQLDSSNVDVVGDAILSVLDNRAQPDLWLDLASINFLSSMVLSKFLKVDSRARSMGGRLTLTNLKPDIRKVFKVSRLDKILNISDGEASEALAG
jgi:anti-anti-sigma factor